MGRWVLLLALLLSTTACMTDTSDPTVAGPATPPTPAVGASPQVTEDVATTGTAVALDFTAQTVDGGPFDGGEHAGQDLMLWFWAPW